MRFFLPFVLFFIGSCDTVGNKPSSPSLNGRGDKPLCQQADGKPGWCQGADGGCYCFQENGQCLTCVIPGSICGDLNPQIGPGCYCQPGSEYSEQKNACVKGACKTDEDCKKLGTASYCSNAECQTPTICATKDDCDPGFTCSTPQGSTQSYCLPQAGCNGNADNRLCNGTCISVKTDRNNCGACGKVCGANETCVNGVCGGKCEDPNLTYCANTCINTQVNTAHCGQCGNNCKGRPCVQGQCK